MSVKGSKIYILNKDLNARHTNLETACVINEEIDNSVFNIIWVKKGKGNYRVDFKEVEVDGSTIFFLNPGQRFQLLSEQASEAYQIGFSKDFHCVEKHNSEIACNGILFNTPGEVPHIKLNADQELKFEFLFQNFFNEFSKDETGKSDMLQSYLRMILVEATRIKSKQEKVKLEQLNDDIRLVSQFNSLVEKHYKKKHNVSDYAKMIGISPKSISKQFKTSNRPKPREVIRDRIILEAKRLLLYTDSSTKEISYELGFDDPAYFSRYFKKAVGVSPLKFKKESSLSV